MKRLHPVQHLVFKTRRWEEGYQAFMLISESVLCNSKKTVPLTFSMKACKIIPLYYAFVIYFLASLHPAILSTGHHFSKRIWMSYYNPFPQHSHKIILISLILLCARNVKILTLHRNVRISYLNSIYIMHIELIAFKHPKT